jgi:hypothetical protein
MVEGILFASRTGNKAGSIFAAIKEYAPDHAVAAVEAASAVAPSQKTLVFPSCIRDPEQVAVWGLQSVVEKCEALEKEGAIDECMAIVKAKADGAEKAPEGGVRVVFVAAAATDEAGWIKRIQSELNSKEKSRGVVPQSEGASYWTTVTVVRDGKLCQMKVSGSSKSRVAHMARYLIARRGDPSYRAFADEARLTVEAL